MTAGFGAPPSGWQSSLGLGGLGRPQTITSIQPSGSLPVALTDLESVTSAWRHIRTVVKDDGKGIDLWDLLAGTVRETQYSFQPGVSALLFIKFASAVR
jgi:hypothetical protein